MTPERLQVWALVGLLATLLPVLGFLLTREFKRKDKTEDSVSQLAAKVTTSIEELNKGLAALTLAVNEIRVWSHERFVPRTEYVDAMEGVRSDIAAHAERFEREFDRCQKACPARRHHTDPR